MSPLICCCVLCGAAIVEWPDTVSWRNQFRGLYSGPEGLVLTGVGVNDDPERGAFVAPPNSNASWDSYELSDQDEFGANQQSPRNSRHGFVFHAACWALLERYLQPNPVPHQRLLQVLDSLPFPVGSTMIGWGHDYGNLLLFGDAACYPWEDWKLYMEAPEPDHVMDRCNPFDISTEISSLLGMVPDHEETPAKGHSLDQKVQTSTFTAVKSNENCFSRLPVELCLAIASSLPTLDALQARMASRAFWPIFHDQQFWASRFQPGGVDRSWLFEIGGQRCLDWRWLYRQTHDSRLSLALSNRRRVWTLVEHVARILELQSHGLTPASYSSSPSPSSLGPQPRSAPQSDLGIGPTLASITVSGDLMRLEPDHSRLHFDKGCRAFYECRIQIPKSIKSVSISKVDVGGTYYIAGLVFASTTGDIIEAGYGSKYHATDSVEVSQLCGFHVALGAKGIYGLKCTVEGGEQSRWLGNVSESLQTERLAHSVCPLEELELGFDGCKLTSMTACLPTLSSRHRDALRTTALWYPEVPHPSMDLNESSFVPRAADRYMSGFRPLFLTHFGGQGGKYLRHLTGINIEGCSNVCRMSFSYDNDVNVPPLGRFQSDEPPDMLTFPIDGPGGEAIVAMDAVYSTRFYAPVGYWTMLICGKWTTNRGRSCSFPQGPPELDPLSTVKSIHTSAAPGTMITAFYGTQNPEFGIGINTLGVVTEKCDPAGLE